MRRFPEYVKKRIPAAGVSARVMNALKEGALHTVCEEARCPNRLECFAKGTATFMILGNVCTRNCVFCAVTSGAPEPVDPHEPAEVAEAVKKLNLQHVVITSVTRDDLPDGGAGVFKDCILHLREVMPETTIEVLTPDFKGDRKALETVLSAHPDVFNHNLETVPRLYPKIRPQANYGQSVGLLAMAKEIVPDILTKSGIMVGLGETQEEVFSVMDDLRRVHCDMLTIGQYLSPTPSHHPIREFIRPEVFVMYRERALEKGFLAAACDTFVRSSYMAEDVLKDARAPHHTNKRFQ